MNLNVLESLSVIGSALVLFLKVPMLKMFASAFTFVRCSVFSMVMSTSSSMMKKRNTVNYIAINLM